MAAVDQSTAPLPPQGDHRERLLGGMALALAEKGYAGTTLADVVRHARVSRRTFYEHFADKEELFLELYASISQEVLAIIARAEAQTDGPWEQRVGASVRAYLETLASSPALSRALLVEIHAAGPRALGLRLEVQKQFATQLVALTAKGTDAPAPLPPRVASAITGGLYELVLLALTDEQDAADLTALTDDATTFVTSVLRGLPASG